MDLSEAKPLKEPGNTASRGIAGIKSVTSATATAFMELTFVCTCSVIIGRANNFA